ncbi:unnamed protein product [Rotaria magnacalcarata]|uniref:FAD dependent oxidoreductase domain-containing protein n=1 Tax=Rotaria magnacalcarata TaxID=392030 RepID=A0A816V0P1_9BILA|nr:unnamed protein product [Rotaria magnacalcarata]CAF4098058.1 unnamed protein product [Rotaria magnacalcarata]
MANPIRICIIGGGIIGASIGFYLSEAGCSNITIIERTNIACGASGRAGGFLAKNWRSGAEGKFSESSFLAHAELAQRLKDEFSTDVMYRRLTTFNITINENNDEVNTNKHTSDKQSLPNWITADVHEKEMLGDEDTTAQVHPGLLTNALVKIIESRGGRVIIGGANGFLFETITTHTEKDEHHQTSPVRAIKLLIEDQEPIEADIFILAMGPWTYQAAPWFRDAIVFKENISHQLDVIGGVKAHSIVLKNNQPTEPYAFFLAYQSHDGNVLDPEIYLRPNGDIYACGFSEEHTQNLPDSGNSVSINESNCERLRQIVVQVASTLKDSNVEIKQACYLPQSSDGSPLIGRLHGLNNVYIAAGHSCWGILNSLATGAQLTQLILKGEMSPFLKQCDPTRFYRRGGHR